MTRIVHLSDLHFGYHRAAFEPVLLQAVNAAGADLVVVTGDLTHRGRADQFAQARRFLDALDARWMCVAGNHDLPLLNLMARLFWPRANYRRAVGDDTRPVRRVGGVQVVGVDSVDRFAHQRGVFTARQADEVAAKMAVDASNVIALHHPIEQLPAVTKLRMRGAARALRRIEEAGAHVILSGHLHVWSAGAFLALHPGRRVLQVQAGTALCARPSDVQNEFAVLDFAGPLLRIERHVAPMDQPGFRPPEVLHFTRADGPWRNLDAPAYAEFLAAEARTRRVVEE